MAGVNRMILVGNLGKAPDARYTTTGNPVTALSVATSSEWTDKTTRQKIKKTEWHKVVLFGKLAETAAHLKKGSKVYLEGRLETRKWRDQQGQDRYTTEIVVDGFDGQMQLLESTSNSANTTHTATTPSDYEMQTPEQFQRQQQARRSTYGRDHDQNI